MKFKIATYTDVLKLIGFMYDAVGTAFCGVKYDVLL